MKKVLILFFFAITVFVSPEITLAQTQEPINESVIIDYDLAFPGILPDHPLYKLKILRDKISAGLISDPLKKINFYLLQTDKGILATAMLVDKNKTDLASETALKAEHNYTLLTYQLYRLSRKPDEAVFGRLRTAS